MQTINISKRVLICKIVGSKTKWRKVPIKFNKFKAVVAKYNGCETKD